MNSKSGEISTSFLVGLIVVVISFVVILGVFISFNWKEDIDAAACKESAVVKATLPDSAKEVVSLTCKTKRICVTASQFNSYCEGEFGEKYSVYRVSGTRDEMENSIKQLMAREMASCWNTLGEGNLEIFKREASPNTYNANAVICSRIMFDKTILEDNGITELDGMSAYLLSHKAPQKEVSYWDYFRNAADGDTLQMLQGDPVVSQSAKEAEAALLGDRTVTDTLDLTKQKAVFYLETSTSDLFGEVIGSVAAGVTFLGSARVVGFKGATFFGVGTYIAGYGSADKWYNHFVAPGFDEEQTAVSGIFLTDYTREGFATFQEQKIEFHNIP